MLAALTDILGTGNVFVSGGPALPNNEITIRYIGDYAGVSAPTLVASNMLTGGANPEVHVEKVATADPVQITSTANTVTATNGNDAMPRVILDGSLLTEPAPGLVVDTSNSQVRGLIIDAFDVGVSVPRRDDVGNRIEGNLIGLHYLYPVSADDGNPVAGPGRVVFAGQGNASQGVLVGGTNTTVGGADPQANNVIVGNGLQGVSILAGSEGNQVLGNQIGIAGPTINGRFVIAPNGAEGVLVASSSNIIGGFVDGAGNLISGNDGDGVRIVGASATRNTVEANFLGIGPGGGFVFGAEGTGNGGDGVRIEDASDNRVGVTTGNVIAANDGAGVRILGSSTRNVLANNLIGMTSDGLAPRGNAKEGVAIFAPRNVVGPGNVISSNDRGVLLSGAGATGNRVFDNRIGTNAPGVGDLGNAREGVRIDGAPDNVVEGSVAGSQVISGNDLGVLLIGPGASGNRVSGNFIGSDQSGTLDVPNAREGVRIEQAPRNTIGGAGRPLNLISGNHWGVAIVGAQAVENQIQNNLIGTDISGTNPLGNGNELDGVLILAGASGNLVGGPSTEDGNTIAFNIRDGVRVEGPSLRNAILTNRIFSNGELGINLVSPDDVALGVTPDDPLDADDGPNLLQNAPRLSAIATSVAFTNIQGTLQSTPNTTFTIQFFANAALDPSGRGEGERYLGETTATTGADGLATFSADVPATVPAGQFVTATATDPAGNTSEFSPGLTEALGTVQFQVAAFDVDESAGSATITVTRTGGSGGLFTVDYATADGTATAGRDYTPVAGTLTFNVGQDVQTFTIPILGDELPEDDETVLLSLTNAVGAATLGSPSTAVLTIRDDDQPGAFFFSMSAYRVEEAAGQAIITVERDSGGGTVSVEYATADGSAKAGVNYGPVAGSLTFGPGELSKSFAVPIVLDPAHPGDLTVLLTLSDPTGGATLGDPASAVLTIRDDTADRDGPVVTPLQARPGRPGVASVRISFSEPLDPARAVNLVNYGYSLRAAGRDGRLGTPDDTLIGLASVVYDPTTWSVTLRPAGVIHRNQPLLVVINAATDVPGAGVGVSDLSGNLLDGNGDGTPGGVFAAPVVARPAAPAGHAWSRRPTRAFRSRRGPALIPARRNQAGIQPPRGAEGIREKTFPSRMT